MTVVIGKVASIFILILIGFGAYRLKILRDDSIPILTALVMQILGPCMGAHAIYSRELTPELIDLTIQVMTGTVLYFIVGTGAAIVLVRLLRFRTKEELGIYVASIVPTNTGFMGFPITMAIFGSEMLYLMAMSNVMLNFYTMMLLPFIFNIGTGWRPNTRDIVRTLASPIVISIFVGLALLIAGIQPPPVVDEIVVMLSDATVPISMILVGVQLGSRNIRGILNANNIKAVILAMVVFPALMFAAVRPLPFLAANVKVALVFMTVLPTAVITVALAQQYHKNAKVLSEIVSLTTLVSIATIPVAATILTMVFL